VIFSLFVCPVCGVAKLQNKSVGEYERPWCTGDGVRGHTSMLSFVHDVDLVAVASGRPAARRNEEACPPALAPSQPDTETVE
jgi:hypothetical protein